MSKYNIDPQLGIYRYLTPPNNTALAGFLGKLMPIPPSFLRDKEIRVKKEVIRSYDGGKLQLLIIEPKNVRGISPCILYIHGGGFVYGASPAHYKVAKHYAVNTDSRVVFVRYRRAPKHPFPTPPNDCFCAYRYILENADELNIDISKIGIAGDSAGGCLAAATTQMIRDNGLIPPRFQMLIYPVTDRRMITESQRIYSDTPMWNSRLSKAMWKCYLTDQNAVNIEYASPMEAKSFDDLPSAYIETAEFDCLRDEATEYARALMSAGVEVTQNHTKGTVHGFDCAIKSDISKDSVKKRVDYIKKMFE